MISPFSKEAIDSDPEEPRKANKFEDFVNGKIFTKRFHFSLRLPQDDIFRTREGAVVRSRAE
jgi:hypothetical protein